MSKNVAVFVDVANIFYAAKAAGVDIDYVTLLKSATAGRDFVRAYAYTGLDPENENQRNFHQFLARNSYRVVSKDIRKYGDGRVKANLDIEMVVDMMKTARNLDVIVLVSGDGDFAPAIRAVQEMGVRVEVICFKANTSSDLIDVADQFIEITQIAKVEKGSSRSGRRVAGDEEDLSMTEVPEKQTEGATERRRRTRARAAESATKTERTPSTRRKAAVTVMPGEKLARHEPDAEAAEPVEESDGIDATVIEIAGEPVVAAVDDADETSDGEGQRRRRRRRGRGRGRGRDGVAADAAEVTDVAEQAPEPDGDAPEAPRSPRAAAFGSIWDRQIGVPSGPRAPSGEADEEFPEPEVPEYLLAERRARGGGGRDRTPNRREAYRTAIDRERYGRGGSGRRSEPHGGYRDAPREAPRGAPRDANRPPRSAEGWSEVPPELEAMLRAQLAARESGAPAAAGSRPAADSSGPVTADKPARRTRSKASTAKSTTDTPTAEAKPARRARSPKTATAAATTGDAKPARRTRSKPAPSAAAGSESVTADGAAEAKPTRRTRTKAAPPA